MSNRFDLEAIDKTAPMTSLGWLLKRAGTARRWVVLSIGLGFFSGVLLILQARLLAHVVQRVFMDDVPRTVLWPFFTALPGVIILRAALGWGREVSGFHAGAGVRQEIRMRLMEHLFNLGPAYTVTRQTGAVSSTIMEAVEGLHDFYAFYLPQLALAIMIPSAILAFVFPISWAAGALLLVTAPLIPLFMVLVGMGAESISQRHFQALARMSAHFLDVLQGLAVLKLFDRSRDEEKNVAGVSNDFRKGTMNVLRIAFLSSAVLEFFSSIAIALVAVYLGMRYLGYLDFGDYGTSLNFAGGFFILLLAPDFYLPLRELGTHYHARASAVGAAEEILGLLSAADDIKPPGTMTLHVSNRIRIDCRNLYLTYREGKKAVLEGVSFDLNPRARVVLLGASGAGKTTILNVLLGFLQPDRGTVLINGNRLDDLKVESWRQHIAWIGQDPVLFHGTIRENIRLGKPKASADEIESAARSARVLDFTVQLPEGLDTRVGERGMNLSRGQAQRIALARAFLKDAPVLLLDEPTAGLDSDNEQLVMRALKKLSPGRTVLLLTHRLLNIESTDRILILENGRIVEQGTHSELIDARGIFYRLVSRVTEENHHA
jgi:ATP-binding cassette subfamily C protein CydD